MINGDLHHVSVDSFTSDTSYFCCLPNTGDTSLGGVSFRLQVNAMSSPADVLLDMLTNKEHQRTLLQSYQEGEEPHEVKNAILMAQQSIAHAPTASHV